MVIISNCSIVYSDRDQQLRKIASIQLTSEESRTETMYRRNWWDNNDLCSFYLMNQIHSLRNFVLEEGQLSRFSNPSLEPILHVPSSKQKKNENEHVILMMQEHQHQQISPPPATLPLAPFTFTALCTVSVTVRLFLLLSWPQNSKNQTSPTYPQIFTKQMWGSKKTKIQNHQTNKHRK